MSHARGHVLAIDDDPAMCKLIEASMAPRGFRVTWMTNPEEALARLEDLRPDVVLSDLRMRELDGLALCALLQKRAPGLPVILLTGFGSIEAAVQATRLGAYDFLSKPLNLDVLELALQRATQHHQLSQELSGLREQLARRQGDERLVGRSAAFLQVMDVLSRAARSDAPVLLEGETGTGKELVAQALHRQSPRCDQPFLALNCATLPEALMDAELFGHTRGAFTDAHARRDGLFVEARRGTLFLDEIGEVPLHLQAKLLRVLQEGKVRPIGANQEVPIHCRIIAATNRPLREEAEQGHFRQDLYYRLAVINLHLPPLRERGHDVLLLAQHFLQRAAERTGRPLQRLEPEAARALLAWRWPGNIRELENCIEHAVALTDHQALGLHDLPAKIARPTPAANGDQESGALLTLDELERRHIARVLDAVDGNKSAAAEILGVDRRTLYRKLER